MSRVANLSNSLEQHWMPFTANRHFKAAPRILTQAEGCYFTTDQGAQVLDGAAQNLEARLTTARLKVEPGAGFGFMNEARADLHAATAAAAGWEAAIAFLGASL